MKLLLFSDLHTDTSAATRIVKLAQDADIVIGAGDFANAGMVCGGVARVGRKGVCQRRKFFAGGFRGERPGVVCSVGEERYFVARSKQSDCAGVCTDWDWDTAGDGTAGARDQTIVGEALDETCGNGSPKNGGDGYSFAD